MSGYKNMTLIFSLIKEDSLPSYQAVHDCLAASKFIPDWLVTSKVLETFMIALLSNDDIHFSDEEFNKETFFVNDIVTLIVGIDKINLVKMMLKLLFM